MHAMQPNTYNDNLKSSLHNNVQKTYGNCGAILSHPTIDDHWQIDKWCHRHCHHTGQHRNYPQWQSRKPNLHMHKTALQLQQKVFTRIAWNLQFRRCDKNDGQIVPAPLKLRPYGAIQMCLLLLLHTHTHPFNGPFPGLPKWAGTRKVNQSGLYWSKRQWVAVASAGPYASLHLDPDR